MEYADLVSVYEELDATTKRLEMTHIIAEALRSASEHDLEAVVLLLQGKVFPAWQKEKKLGVSSNYVVQVIHRVAGVPEQEVEDTWADTGDLGRTAEELIEGKQQETLFSKSLSVSKVIENLRELPDIEGEGSVDRKLQLIAELLSSASPVEAKYIVRTVLETLRLGVGSGTIRDAIAWAFLEEELDFTYEDSDITVKNRERYDAVIETVQAAYDKLNDFAEVAREAKDGLERLEQVEIKLGRPLQVMLAKTVEDVAEGFEKVGRPAQLEHKYDGFRMQIVKDGKEIKIYTRRLEDVTEQFPDVVRYVRDQVGADRCILDGEAVGYDPDTEEYKPFQDISQRIKRKYDIDEMAEQLPVEVNVFDLLYLDGESMIHEPLHERRDALEAIIDGEERKLRVATALVTGDTDEAMQFYHDAKEQGMEGVMMKNRDSPYKPGSRVGYMVKLKPTMETLDLAIVEAEWGEGKRSGWLTSYTLACQDANGELQTVGKVATGIKELEDSDGVTFGDMTELLEPLIVNEDGREVEVTPEVVIEVEFNEIQQSPTYDSGYALRFPRLVQVREDKPVSEVSELSLVKELYERQ